MAQHQTRRRNGFLADGRRISARATNKRLDHTTDYNSFVKRAITTYFDFAWYPLTRDQMEVICNSNNVKIKVYGNDGINEYGTGKNGYNELLETFYKNNKKFFNEEIFSRAINNSNLSSENHKQHADIIRPNINSSKNNISPPNFRKC